MLIAVVFEAIMDGRTARKVLQAGWHVESL